MFAKDLLPEAILQEEQHNPWGAVKQRAHEMLIRRSAAIVGPLTALSQSVFGFQNGFYYLPAAQARAWGLRDEDLLADFLAVQAVGHFHFKYQDAVIDEAKVDPTLCLISDVCLIAYLEGLDGFTKMTGKPYRQLHNKYYDEYVAAIMRDLNHRSSLVRYSPSEIRGLAGKSAPGATSIHVAADLAGVSEGGPRAADSLLSLCTGLQLIDDVIDSPIDASAGNLTMPVTAALMTYPNLDVTNSRDVQAAVIGSGAARVSIRLAQRAFEDSVSQAHDGGASILAELAERWRLFSLSYLEELEELVG